MYIYAILLKFSNALKKKECKCLYMYKLDDGNTMTSLLSHYTSN